MFLFSVPKNNILLQVLYSPETGAIVQEQSKESIEILAAATDMAKVAQIYKTAQAYSIDALKVLAEMVYNTMQEEGLTVADVIYEQMDLLDMRLAEEQKARDEDAVDQWAEQKGELSMS